MLSRILLTRQLDQREMITWQSSHLPRFAVHSNCLSIVFIITYSIVTFRWCRFMLDLNIASIGSITILIWTAPLQKPCTVIAVFQFKCTTHRLRRTAGFLSLLNIRYSYDIINYKINNGYKRDWFHEVYVNLSFSWVYVNSTSDLFKTYCFLASSGKVWLIYIFNRLLL